MIEKTLSLVKRKMRVQCDAEWELFLPEISKFVKTAVLILTMTMVKGG